MTDESPAGTPAPNGAGGLDAFGLDSNQEQGFLGLVVEGSLTQGVEVRLDPGTSVENIKAGTFVTIQGDRYRFFGVATDISLGNSDPRLKHLPLDLGDPFISQALLGTVAYGTVSVLPNLVMPLVLGDPRKALLRPRPSRPNSHVLTRLRKPT